MAKTKPTATEHQEQSALFAWAETRLSLYPELALMFAIPNGGHRHKAVAAKLKKEGVKAGVPDVCLPVARGGWHGMYIEMKRSGEGRVGTTQAGWHKDLSAQGYRVEVCWSWVEAMNVIVDYMNMTEKR